MDKFPPEYYELSPKRQAFVREWLIDRNGTQAAIRAGYSAKSASVQAADLLAIPKIKDVVDICTKQIREEALQKYEITEEKILRELHRLAFHDPRNLHNEDGSLKSPHEWDDDTAAAMAGIETFEEFAGRGENRTKIGNTKKVKVWDKKGALELLGRYKGMWKDVGSKDNPLNAEGINFVFNLAVPEKKGGK